MLYLIFYFAVGIFLASAAAFHSMYKRDKFLIAFAITVAFWPLLVLVTPESFLRSDHIGTDSDSPPQDLLKEKLTTLIDAEGASLTEEENLRLARAAKCGTAQISLFENWADFEDILFKYWNLNVPPEIYQSLKRALLKLDEQYDPEPPANPQAQFSLRAPDWYVGFSNEFVRSITKVDRKKQGRILEAIGKISAAPIEIYGDTIKPLTGNLAGLWRCRLGDDRLIYYPDPESKRVILISFASRGEAYVEMPDVSALI